MKQAVARALSVLFALVVYSPVLAHAATVAAGAEHSVFVAPDGQVWTWGRNYYGQLGTNEPSSINHTSPVAVPGLTDVIAVAAGDYHTLALRSDGTVVAWGENNGRLGDGTTTLRTAPVAISGLSNIIAVAASGNQSMALAADGTVYAWGFNWYGNLGNGSVNDSQVPTVSTGLSGAVAIAAGSWNTYAIKTDGTVWGAGANAYGELGLTPGGHPTPVQMGTVANVTAVAAGFDFSIVLESNQTAWAAGSDTYGQLGNGVNGNVSTPTILSTLPAATALAAGYRHALGLAADGTVWSWGQNGWGQLGDGTQNNRGTPAAIAGLTNIVKIASGLYHCIAVDADGTVYTWGYNIDGELGNGSTLYSTTPVAISGPNHTWKIPAPSFSVGTGTYATDQVVTIASSVAGVELHYTVDGTDPTQTSPTIASGGTVTIDRTKTLKARAWKTGWTTSVITSATYTMTVANVTIAPASGLYAAPRSVTMGTTTPSATIYYTTDGSTPTQASANYTAALSITMPTTVQAFGVRSGWTSSAVSTATYDISLGTLSTPVITPAAGSYTSSVTVSISAGGGTIHYTTDNSTPTESSPTYTAPFVLSATATVRAGAFQAHYLPSAIAVSGYTILVANPVITPTTGTYAADQTITVISATPGADVRYTLDGTDPLQNGLAITASGHLVIGTYTLKARAWKTGCTPSAIVSATFTTAGALTTPAIAAGAGHSLALRSDGQLWGWGDNNSLELGDNTWNNHPTPQVVPGLTGVRQVTAGSLHNLALMGDGSLMVWGENSDGRLGIGNNTPQGRPVPIPGLTTVVAMDGGSQHSIALRADGTVVSWGSNVYGQLGDNSNSAHNTPMPVPGLTNVVAVKVGNYHSLALRSDGTVRAWGLNTSGQLGDGTPTNRFVPTSVTGLTNVRAVDGGYLSSIAVLTDGTVWTWGDNSYGQLGAVGASRTTAAAVPDLTHFVQVAAGVYHLVLLRADGTVWTFGRDLEGQLGDGLTTNRATPAQVAGLSDIVAVAAGEYHSMALAANGTVWVWGRNFNGTIGNGSTTPNALVPVAITLSNLAVRVPAPVIAPGSGTFASAQNVTITSSMPGTTIHYTLDSSDPTDQSPTYTVPLSIATHTVITARAFRSGLFPSLPTTAPLTFNYGTLATPTATPAGGNFQGAVSVAISGPASATVRYTTDGTDPSESAAVYGGPLTFSSTTTLKARAFRADSTQSAVMTEAYTNPCTFTVAPTTLTAGAQASGGLLTITAGDPGCSWSATSTVPWITLGAAGGSGSAPVPYAIAANTGATARQGALSIAGQTIAVSQGSGGACTFSLTPGGVAATANAGVGTITVTPSDASCTWSAASDAAWLTFQVDTQTRAYAQAVLADHPVGYWRLDAASGATTVADTSGGAHAGAVTGTVTFGQPGALADGATAAVFDGATAAIAVPHDPAFALPALSWEAWINVPQTSAQARRVLGKGTANEAFALWLQANATQPTIVWTTVGGGRQSVTLTTAIVAAGWVHVAFTDDGMTWHAFVNGVEDQSGSLADAVASNSSALIFGRDDATPPGSWYDAALADVALYPYALSADQIANHYALRTAVWSGTGQLAYSLAENQTGTVRSATLTIAGSAVPVFQGATGDLVITGYVTPTPNSQGWNKTNATVSFACAGSGTVTCPAPVPVTTEGVQNIARTASSDGGQSATATVTVRVDKTPPTLSIVQPTAGTVLAPGGFAILGTVSDALSDVIVTCDGQVATVTVPTFVCQSTISSGAKTIVVRAIDSASNVRTANVTVQTSNGLAIEPTELRITPQQVKMLVGDTRTFSVHDNLGRVPTDAVWTVSDSSVATIAVTPTVMLGALAAGDITVTASWHGLTATTQVTVLTSSTMTAGTVLWVAPPVLATVTQIVQGTAPDGRQSSYVVESNGTWNSSDLIRAFDADGSELWSASAEGKVLQLSSTPLSGAVAEVGRADGTRRLRSFDASGAVTDVATWEQARSTGFAISPIGPLYRVEPNGDLVSVDIGAGGGGTRVQLPRSEQRNCTGGTHSNPTGCTSLSFFEGAGTPTVLFSGDVVVPVVTGSYTVIAGQTDRIKDTRTISAFFLKPDGQTTVTPVYSDWGEVSISPFKAIPNGAGGVLVAWNEIGYLGPNELTAEVAAVKADGTVSGTDLIGRWWGDLVLGEQGDILAVTLNGPRGGPYTRRQLTHLTPDAGIGQFYVLDHSEVTTIVAAKGGGFVINYADGTITGPDPSFDQMHLANARYADDGRWVGTTVGDIDHASLLSMKAAVFAVAPTDSPLFGGNGNNANGPYPRPLDTKRLRKIAEDAGFKGTGIVYSRTVGRLFQDFVIWSLRRPLGNIEENTAHYTSGARSADVIPDVVTTQLDITFLPPYFLPASIFPYPLSAVIEVKAVKGTIGMTSSNNQTIGLLDVAYHTPLRTTTTRTPATPDPPLVFVTTDDTKLSRIVKSCAYELDVDLQQSIVEEVMEKQLRVGLAESRTRPYLPLVNRLYKRPSLVITTYGRTGALLDGQPNATPPHDIDIPEFVEDGSYETDPPDDPLPPLPACNYLNLFVP
jgi:alpha-tubulin suppressor-like RCC1 family protein